MIDQLNAVADNNIGDADIQHVSIHGKDKKHIKIAFSTKHIKTALLQAVKRDRPTGIFVSDYLTKFRSALFFKLRMAKKDNVDIVATYTVNGNIYARVANNNIEQWPFILKTILIDLFHAILPLNKFLPAVVIIYIDLYL